MSHEIKTENLIDSGKDDFGSLESFFCLELEDHGHLLKVNVFLQHDPMNLLKAFSLVTMFDFLKDKKLINLVFLLYQLLTADNGQILFILTFLNSKHLGYLTSITLEQIYRQLTELLERVVVIQLDAVTSRDDDGAH